MAAVQPAAFTHKCNKLAHRVVSSFKTGVHTVSVEAGHAAHLQAKNSQLASALAVRLLRELLSFVLRQLRHSYTTLCQWIT